MKPVFTFLAAASLVVPLAWTASDDRAAPAESDPAAAKTKAEVDRWMQVKLKSSQEAFAGLTSGDFDLVQKSARRMQVLSLLEQWSRRRGEFVGQSDYEGQLNAFDFATKELVREAAEKDAEGALEAYVQLSRSCVRCHQLIRDVRTAP